MWRSPSPNPVGAIADDALDCNSAGYPALRSHRPGQTPNPAPRLAGVMAHLAQHHDVPKPVLSHLRAGFLGLWRVRHHRTRVPGRRLCGDGPILHGPLGHQPGAHYRAQHGGHCRPRPGYPISRTGRTGRGHRQPYPGFILGLVPQTGQPSLYCPNRLSLVFCSYGVDSVFVPLNHAGPAMA